MNQWAAVVLAAGKGVRMNSQLSKVLHTVCGKEMLRHVVDAVQTVIDGPVVVVTSPDAHQVRQCLGDTVEYVEVTTRPPLPSIIIAWWVQIGDLGGMMRKRPISPSSFDDLILPKYVIDFL